MKYSMQGKQLIIKKMSGQVKNKCKNNNSSHLLKLLGRWVDVETVTLVVNRVRIVEV